MTKPTFTAREAFRIGYRFARNIAKRDPRMSACSVADQVVFCATNNGFDYEPFLKANRAILFAILWRGLTGDKKRKLPLWASEAHIGLIMSETESRSWYEPPASYLPA